MSYATSFRGAAALTVATMLVACGDSDTTGSGLVEPQPSAPRFSVIESLITFTGGGGGSADAGSPTFSLSSLPATVEEGEGWGSTISIVPNDPFAPTVAVDYGDGGGAQNVTVNGGDLVLPIPTEPDPVDECVPEYDTIEADDGTLILVDLNECWKSDGPESEEPSYSFHLGHTYAEPGTYTVAVAAQNSQGTRILTETITVTEDPDLYIENFEMTSPVIQGQRADLSFDARGPGEELFDLTISYFSADGSVRQTSHTRAAPGGTKSWHHIWEEFGTFDLRLILSNGVNADTLIHAVTVEPAPRPPPSLDDLQLPDTILAGEESEVSFVTNDPTEGVALTYQIVWVADDLDSVLLEEPSQPGATITLPVEFPKAGVYDLLLILSSVKGGVTKTDTVPYTLTVIDLVCEAGTYRNGVDCVDAPVGHHVPEAGALEAIPCPFGSYQDQVGQVACLPAPAGSFVAVTAATQATLCPAGSFQDQVGQTACKSAPAGSFVAVTGAAQATLCPAGSFQDETGAIACEEAPAGHYVEGQGAISAEPCAPGTFAASTGQSACDPAPMGSFVDQLGRSEAQLCAPGSYSDSVGAVACTSAPIGSYVDIAGATGATTCPVTTSTLAIGSTSRDQCIALGEIALVHIDEAVGDGTLVPASAGKGGQRQFDGWVSDLSRSVDFLEGTQFQAGCSGVGNALAKADGDPSPKDAVTGPARDGIAGELRRIHEENGCQA